MMMSVMTFAAGALQRRRQFVETDRTVAIAVQFAEDVIGRRGVGSTGAERIFKFRFGDRAIAIAIDLRKQVLQRGRAAG